MDARGKPVAANREKALFSHIFSYAIRWGVVKDNPCRNVKRNPEKPRDRYVQDWEYDLVYDLAPRIVRAMMGFASITGLRLGDILRVKIADIKPDSVTTKIGKTGSTLVFERTAELDKIMDMARDRKVSSLYLFCTREGQPYTPDGFASIWQRLMTKAVKTGMERFTFHDLRAKAGSEADNPTELLGHDDPKTTNRVYRRKPRRVRPVR